MQRVEEKVRVQLHLEGLQLSLRELRFELRGAHFAVAIAVVVAESVNYQDDNPVSSKVFA